MNLRQKSLFISSITGLVLIVIVSLVIYKFLMVQFQELENQRVMRNNRRVSAIIEDRFNQLSSKITDWTNWDDTYNFMSDENVQYIESNLADTTFSGIGVDTVLFINKDGKIIWNVDTTKNLNSNVVDLSSEINRHFATGSVLLNVDGSMSMNKGILKTDNGLLFFVHRNVYRSSGEGETNGSMVFGMYFDSKLIDVMKELTQFDARVFMWDDTNMPSDFLKFKDNFKKRGEKIEVRTINDQIVSGYVLIDDLFGNPAAIVRTDISRDITLQGQRSLNTLVLLLMMVVISSNAISYFLLTNVVLGKILLTIKDVDNLRTSVDKKRLESNVVGNKMDEIDKLREEINEMLESLENEKQKGETLLDLVDVLVVTIDTTGSVLRINKKGLEILGYVRGEVEGRNWFEYFVLPEDREKTFGVFNRLIEDEFKDNAKIENRVMTKDKRDILVSWHNTVVKDLNGKVLYTLSLGEDVTLKKEEEIRKEEYGKELERLNQSMVGRELRMIELKNEIKLLQNSINGKQSTRKQIIKEKIKDEK